MSPDHVKLKLKTNSSLEKNSVKGLWQPIKITFDNTASEQMNVGIVFTSETHKEVRLLDTFDRVQCLYDKRVDINYLSSLLEDIEEYIYSNNYDPNTDISSNIHLGNQLYASGKSVESILDRLFDDVVTLGRPKESRNISKFKYSSTSKVRTNVLELMKEDLGLAGSSIIQEEGVNLDLRNGRKLFIEIPLLSRYAAGTIASGWYKSPTVVENQILRAGQDLITIVNQGLSCREAALSILTPGKDSGLNSREYEQVNDVIIEQINRLQTNGIEVIQAHKTAELSMKTLDWWSSRAA